VSASAVQVPQRRSLSARLALGSLQWLAVLALTLAAGEAVARLVFGVRPLTSASMLWSYHPRWGWHHEPGADGTFVKLGLTQPIHINSHGLREREIAYEKPPGLRRVMVIGDSAVVGFEVAPEAVFTRVAEERLRGRGYEVELVNAGVRGWGTDQSLLFLGDEGIRYQPDVVLYKWTGNDHPDNVTVHRPFRRYGKPWFTLDDSGALVLQGVPVPEYPYASNLRVGEDGELHDLPVSPRSRATLWLRDVVLCQSAFATGLTQLAVTTPDLAGQLTRMGTYRERVAEREPNRESRMFRVTVALVGEMKRVAAEAGAEFHMITGREPWGVAVREAVGLPETGLHERFQASLPDGESAFVPGDPHWNELGHRVFGEVLADWLVESGLLGEPSAREPRRASS
jgi:hypothetical protein